MALSIALNQYIDNIESDYPPTNNTLTIFSDSQAALHLLNNPMTMSTAQYLSLQLQELVQHVSTNHTINLYWTPGHHDVELNEKADEAAGLAAASEGERDILLFSLSCARQHVRRMFNKRGADIDRNGYKTTGKAIAIAFDNLEKGRATIIFQLRSGHCPLKHFLTRIQATPNICCEQCGEKETTVHFLLYFPRYTKQRRTFRNALKEAKVKLDTRRATIILDCREAYQYLSDFIAATGRLEHLPSYIEL